MIQSSGHTSPVQDSTSNPKKLPCFYWHESDTHTPFDYCLKVETHEKRKDGWYYCRPCADICAAGQCPLMKKKVAPVVVA